jgi:hypothetical protein
LKSSSKKKLAGPIRARRRKFQFLTDKEHSSLLSFYTMAVPMESVEIDKAIKKFFFEMYSITMFKDKQKLL